jgi:hypothetical protein
VFRDAGIRRTVTARGAAMKRLAVLFLPQPGVDPVWQAEIEAAVGARHDLRIYDRNAPLEPQFRGVHAVIDTGGSAGRA